MSDHEPNRVIKIFIDDKSKRYTITARPLQGARMDIVDDISERAYPYRVVLKRGLTKDEATTLRDSIKDALAEAGYTYEQRHQNGKRAVLNGGIACKTFSDSLPADVMALLRSLL